MEEIRLLYIDLFCGAGGTSTGVEQATLHGAKCAKVVACVNHDPNAILSHAANHPDTKHFTEDIRTLEMEPLKAALDKSREQHPNAKTVLWASLECTNFSRAKGGLPRDADSRTLADHLFRYIEALQPDYIQIENVEEFMSWGEIDENGKPISKHKGTDYLRWVEAVRSHGYTYSWRLLNAADFGAYTSRKRFFGQFAKTGMPHAFPTPTYSKTGESADNLFGVGLHRWKAVKEVLDLEDDGESIFTRKKPLVEATLKRIYAGLVKFVANGDTDTTLIKYNSMSQRGTYIPPSMDDPCPTIAVQQRLGLAKCHFLSKQFSGDERSKNVSVEAPAGTITTRDHHAIITFYGKGQALPIDRPSPTLTTKDRIAKVKFIANEYGNSGNGNSLNGTCPAITTRPKQAVVSADCFLMNTQYNSKGGSVDDPCFTLIARMDKRPPYLIQTEKGIGIEVYDTDSEMMRKIKEFMANHCIIDIKMRMLKIPELKAIMGFPRDYVLRGTQSEQKKFIGNAVEVNQSRVLCEALAGALEKGVVA